MVVLALIALMAIVGIPKVSSIFKLSLNSATRDVASIVRETYNSTMLTGKVHRLVFDLKEHHYWVEVGPNTVLLDTKESKEKDERKKRNQKESEKTQESSGFMQDATLTKKKIPLPRGIEFVDVLTEASPEPLKEGKAYAHFFPHGITERTIIHLKDIDNHEISLVISPLVGRTKLINRYVKGDDPDAL